MEKDRRKVHAPYGNEEAIFSLYYKGVTHEGYTDLASVIRCTGYIARREIVMISMSRPASLLRKYAVRPKNTL